MNDAHQQEKSVIAETQRGKIVMDTADQVLKTRQNELRSAQERYKSLSDKVQELASEHSKLELEMSDKREKTPKESVVNALYFN